MTKMKNSWNLLSCPFCGGRPELIVSPHFMNNSYNQVRIECTKCHVTTKPYMDGSDINGHIISTSDAIKKIVDVWNRRNGIVSTKVEKERKSEERR